MRELHERAADEIAKQDEAKKKQLAVEAASKVVLNTSSNPNINNQNGQKNEKEIVVDSDEEAEPGNVVVNSPAGHLPGIVVDDYTYRLVDLVASDFKMPESDRDF